VIEDPWLAGLALIVNAAVVYGEPPGLLAAIRTGRAVVGNELYLFGADDDTDLAEARAQWRSLTGTELDESGPLAIAGAGFLSAASIVPWAVLRELTEGLLARRAGWHPPPPAEGAERIIELEDLAAAIDHRRARVPAGEPESPDLVALRQVVLRDLSAEGLLDPDGRPRLETAGASTLLDWNDTATEAARYLAGDGRRRYRADASLKPVWGSPVCLDLFRGGLVVPPTVDPDHWASWGEVLLANTTGLDAEQGEFLYHDADGWVQVRWRRDHPDVPALLGIALSG